jgi:hypothetical protein
MGSFFDVIKCDKIYLLRFTNLQKDRKCNYDDVNHVTDLDKELETEIHRGEDRQTFLEGL